MGEPIVDIDGARWDVYSSDDDVMINIWDGLGLGPGFTTHDRDGDHHEGDTLLILDHANAARLTAALATALAEPIGGAELGETVNEDGLFPEPERDERRFVPTDPPWPR